MHSSIVLFSAFIAAAMASPQTSGTVPLGSACTSSSQCAAGVSCYAVNSMLVTICGNQGASCTTDAQCAFNTCVSGSCSGFLSSSSAGTSVAPSTTSRATTVPTTTALALGASCTSTSQCATGVECYAVNSNLVARCGNQGATCTSNSECAFNTCVSGSCNGALSSSTFASITGSATTSPLFSSSTIIPITTSKVVSDTNLTSTGVPAGFTTSVTVVNGVTSSVLVNSAGATTSFGAVATTVTTITKGNGAGNLAVGFGKVFVVGLGAAFML